MALYPAAGQMQPVISVALVSPVSCGDESIHSTWAEKSRNTIHHAPWVQHRTQGFSTGHFVHALCLSSCQKQVCCVCSRFYKVLRSHEMMAKSNCPVLKCTRGQTESHLTEGGEIFPPPKPHDYRIKQMISLDRTKKESSEQATNCGQKRVDINVEGLSTTAITVAL